MEHILAIDPGTTRSGVVVIDELTYRPLRIGKFENKDVVDEIEYLLPANKAVIEMVPSYGTGMAAGKDIYETCIWIGRFIEQLSCCCDIVQLLQRNVVKMHLCQSARAKDPNVIQALVDRFAPGEPNYGKGTKKAPGWFYGFKADVWQAYALAVTYLDMKKEGKI